MISILAIFSVGSALCGAASSRSVFLLGRSTSFDTLILDMSSNMPTAVQGMGGGGIASLANLIVADLVPLSERGKYNALLGVYDNLPFPLLG